MAFLREGPLVAWRIADRRHPVFSGEGAALFGGRWNSRGQRVIYASASYAGAMLEMLVHAGVGKLPKNQVSIRIDIPQTVTVEEIEATDVPGWDQEDVTAPRAYGDAWVKSERSCVLLVPSIVARHENNVLINEAHPDSHRLKLGPPEPVDWDRRLFPGR